MQDIENNEIDVTEGLDSIDETAAADTLKPGAGSGGSESRAATLSTFTQLLAQLGREDLTDLFNQVQAQYGPNQQGGVGDTSAQNKASIKSAGALPADPMPTLGVREDVEEMFAGDKLSEDFKERAEVVFEAALNTRLTLEKSKLEEAFDARVAELEEQFEETLTEQSTKIFEDVTGKLNDYLDYAINEWMTANQLAIDNGLRADIAENFIQGLHSLFTEHYIKVPETELDIVAEMKAELEDLRGKLNEQIDENIQLKNVVAESTREDIVAEVAEGLTLVEADKLGTLTEGLEFVDASTFRRKVELIKENYFNKKTAASGILVEEADESSKLDEASPVVSSEMEGYLQALKKVSKR